MRALSTRRRYERMLPVLLAIVVTPAVTAALAWLVLPAGDGNDDGGPGDALVTGADVVAATPSGEQAELPDDAPPPTSTPEATAVPTEPPPTPTARGIRRPSPTATPTPTSGPVLAERNLVANGDFGDGLNG